jgi:hypothetical protein
LWGAAISVLAVSVVVVAGEAGTCIGHLTARVVDWIRADVSLLAGRSSSKTCVAAPAMLGDPPTEPVPLRAAVRALWATRTPSGSRAPARKVWPWRYGPAAASLPGRGVPHLAEMLVSVTAR